jgi:hypothetical protein
MLRNNGFKHSGGTFQRLLPAYALPRQLFVVAHFGVQQPVAGVHYGIVQVHAFRAQHTPVYRVFLIPAYFQLALPVLLHNYAAAHTAITTGSFKRCRHARF